MLLTRSAAGFAWLASSIALRLGVAARARRGGSRPGRRVLAHLRDTAFKVLRRQCTDPRFISPARGGFDGHAEEGRYLCAACHSPLYASDAKFEAGCGWPAFHSNVDGAVRAVACLAHDVEGVARELPYREIVCNACSSHLGHVFTGEGHGHATDGGTVSSAARPRSPRTDPTRSTVRTRGRAPAPAGGRFLAPCAARRCAQPPAARVVRAARVTRRAARPAAGRRGRRPSGGMPAPSLSSAPGARRRARAARCSRGPAELALGDGEHRLSASGTAAPATAASAVSNVPSAAGPPTTSAPEHAQLGERGDEPLAAAVVLGVEDAPQRVGADDEDAAREELRLLHEERRARDGDAVRRRVVRDAARRRVGLHLAAHDLGDAAAHVLDARAALVGVAPRDLEEQRRQRSSAASAAAARARRRRRHVLRFAGDRRRAGGAPRRARARRGAARRARQHVALVEQVEAARVGKSGAARAARARAAATAAGGATPRAARRRVRDVESGACASSTSGSGSAAAARRAPRRAARRRSPPLAPPRPAPPPAAAPPSPRDAGRVGVGRAAAGRVGERAHDDARDGVVLGRGSRALASVSSYSREPRVVRGDERAVRAAPAVDATDAVRPTPSARGAALAPAPPSPPPCAGAAAGEQELERALVAPRARAPRARSNTSRAAPPASRPRRRRPPRRAAAAAARARRPSPRPRGTRARGGPTTRRACRRARKRGAPAPTVDAALRRRARAARAARTAPSSAATSPGTAGAAGGEGGGATGAAASARTSARRRRGGRPAGIIVRARGRFTEFAVTVSARSKSMRRNNMKGASPRTRHPGDARRGSSEGTLGFKNRSLAGATAVTRG